MRKIIVILLLGFILIPVKSHTEYWGELGIEKALTEKLSFEVNSRLRFKTGISDLYKHRTEVGPVFQINKFSATGLCFEIEEHREGGRWQGTNLFGLHIRLYDRFSIFNLMHGSRIDCQDFGVWRYRNSLRIIGSPYVIYEKSIYYGQVPTICKLSPCLEEEIFFNINESKIDESHLLLSVYFEVVPYLVFKLGYMAHSQSEMHTKGVIVTTLGFTFLGTE